MNGTYGYWPRLVIPEPIHEGPQMVICAWCKPQHIMSDGYQPASHSMCPKAVAEVEAEMNER